MYRKAITEGKPIMTHPWIKHWQSLPARNQIGAALTLVGLIVIIVALVFQISDLVAGIHEAAPTPTPADPAAIQKPSGAARHGSGKGIIWGDCMQCDGNKKSPDCDGRGWKWK